VPSHASSDSSDLPDRLRAAGFTPEERETVLIAPVEALTTEPTLPDGVTTRQVTQDTDLRRVAQLESTIWHQDWNWLADDLVARLAAAPNDTAVFVAEAASHVVSAAWPVIKPGTEFAGL
jgi:hypothetical protein